MKEPRALFLLFSLVFALLMAGCGSTGDLPPGKGAENGLEKRYLGETLVRDEAALRKLMGDHLFSLQWISWEEFGTATVYEQQDGLHIRARQESPEGDDHVTVDGKITEVAENYFLINGVIETRVSFINNGEPCRREGQFTFGINFNRKYWRLQEMSNPCEGGNLVDYIDVFFARPGGEPATGAEQ